MLTLTLADASLEVVLLRRRRKSIGIRIVDGRVEVAAPERVPLAQLQRLLDQKRDWIAQHWRHQVATLASRRSVPRQVLLAGVALTLSHVACDGARMELQSDGLRVYGAPELLKPQVAGFLRQEASHRFPERLALFAPQAVRPPRRLQLSAARSRWGSCNSQEVIRLNWRLVQAPLPILDYVIAHELAHLRHMNHSAAFWSETARLYPDWQNARAWLKRHGDTLFVFG